MYCTTFSDTDTVAQGVLWNDKCNLKLFGVIVWCNVEALSLRTILTVNCSGHDSSGRRWGRTMIGSGGLCTHNREGEPLHRAITVELVKLHMV